ncbi:thiamine pyrophosphate-requiring protein [Polymorphum gilvum]|uniref:Acetolactate synthase large subunit n=1 Tax=Polymorphum gilvum (strain LMG 25793 / CGMCC 1.9160 / SL003B-26A1) TaxID=991905 RepID=F2IYN3_POLGS|nr:thiamine pyrophosphate-requiring protein [Polymorphum gilvum]ADZ69480.1 Acetolactate synthase large subunit [Polymorphum gilvum SL003B-26A1]
MMREPVKNPGKQPKNGAEAVLLGLKRSGVNYLFANAGTDFPPIIEALAALGPDEIPEPVTVPHETAGVAMAHGYYLVTGKAQAVMVHVNVGLANSVMGMINAASDNVPVIVLSGRTPITERGRPGSRITPIQYGQEMYDQTAMIGEITKFYYEMRYPEQGEPLVARAAALAMSEPRGPVYLSLPREPLMEDIAPSADFSVPANPPATAPRPDPDAIATAATWLAGARHPLILCQRSDTQGLLAERLSALCNRHGIGVVEPFTIRNVMASDDPMFLGYDPRGPMAAADVVLVLDSGVPWIEALHRPGPDVRVIHVGPDPLFQRMPVRGYQADLVITSDATAAIVALDAALDAAMPASDERAEKRRIAAGTLSETRRTSAKAAAVSGCASPMSAEWMSLCLSEALDERAVVFGELGVVPGAMTLKGPNRMFNNPHSGGLGWALPAALGAQLADRERLVVACIGDGSYIFANPVACHQIAEALDLPILVMIKNNGLWNAVRRSVVNAYPKGAAARANTMPLTSLEPAPDYLQVAAASRAYTERVEHGRDLPAALERAIKVIRTERRQAVLDLRIAVSDSH